MLNLVTSLASRIKHIRKFCGISLESFKIYDLQCLSKALSFKSLVVNQRVSLYVFLPLIVNGYPIYSIGYTIVIFALILTY